MERKVFRFGFPTDSEPKNGQAWVETIPSQEDIIKIFKFENIINEGSEPTCLGEKADEIDCEAIFEAMNQFWNYYENEWLLWDFENQPLPHPFPHLFQQSSEIIETFINNNFIPWTVDKHPTLQALTNHLGENLFCLRCRQMSIEYLQKKEQFIEPEIVVEAGVVGMAGTSERTWSFGDYKITLSKKDSFKYDVMLIITKELAYTRYKVSFLDLENKPLASVELSPGLLESFQLATAFNFEDIIAIEVKPIK